MNIAMIGTGYVGLTTGTCLANLGNTVICVDIDEAKVENLKKGILPIYEPGLKELVELNYKADRLSFTTDIEAGIKHAEVIFIAVGTPDNKGKADMRYIYSVAESIGRYMNNYKVVVIKSTVPVGTYKEVKDIIKNNQKEPIEFDMVSNPEFLREGEAVNDFMVPDRVVIGTESKRAEGVMFTIYRAIERTGRPILFTDIKSSEMIKYVSNAMLATRISFMNEISRLCEKVGADVKLIAKGIGLDSRIGSRFLQAGVGYGGSCFPKDVKALIDTMKKHGCKADILDAVDTVNDRQKRHIVDIITASMGDVKGRKFALWGLAFKPKTDDMREAPSIVIINELQQLGAEISAYDPIAQEAAQKIFNNIKYEKSPYDAAKDADAVILVTEWDEFRDLDFTKVKGSMKQPFFFDGRNVHEPHEMKMLGFKYYGVGR